MSNFLGTNPNRPPAWRWAAANYMVDRQERLPISDSFVSLARQFLTRMRACQTAADLILLRQRSPGWLDAWEIFNDRSPTSFRWLVEARILARQTAKEI